MTKVILLNYETGCFFEAYSANEIKEIIKTELDNGADLENLGAYKAEALRIDEVVTKKVEYKLSKLV